MRGGLCGKLHCGSSQLFARPAVIVQFVPIAISENRNFCLLHLHSTVDTRIRGSTSEYCHNVWYEKTTVFQKSIGHLMFDNN